jgi:predicted Zn-dependent protease
MRLKFRTGKTRLEKKRDRLTVGTLLLALIQLSGCIGMAGGPYPPPRAPGAERSSYGNSQRGADGDSREAQRLRRIITPLVRAMDRPCPPNELRVGLVRHNEINAANAGGCQFYVTTELLQRASDDQLRGVMAHEIAHEDLGHVAKAQVLGAGLSAGVAFLEQLLPGSSALTPLAGTLIARGYGRSEEYAADRHAIEILRRAGYPKEIMIDALSWIRGAGGDGGGGFFSTHPALDDRIAELRRFG